MINQREYILKSRELEYPEIIKQIEAIFREERGYIFQIPEPKSPVILLVSGGLDTTVIWNLLLEKYKLHVYPLFLKRGQKRTKQEEKSVDYFSSYFKEKFPKLYHQPMKINAPNPPFEIRWSITSISNELINPNSKQKRGVPQLIQIMTMYACQYAAYLEIAKNLHIRTIFCGVVAHDGEVFSYETLTALRTINLDLCVSTHDFSWQVTSLAIEPYLDRFWDKADLIREGDKLKLPLEYTWSCFHARKVHCGSCPGCNFRQKSFIQVGVKDKTIYYNKLSLVKKLLVLL